jgi:hypothetical protein
MEAPPVIIRPAKHAFWQFGALLLIAAAWFVLYRYDPVLNGFYPRCYLYTTTGLLCPGCGSLRAMHHLAHGEILTAMHDNVMLVAGIPAAIFYVVRRWVAGVRTETPPRFAPSPRLLIWTGIALTLFGILRNIPASPFTYLAPL